MGHLLNCLKRRGHSFLAQISAAHLRLDLVEKLIHRSHARSWCPLLAEYLPCQFFDMDPRVLSGCLPFYSMRLAAGKTDPGF